MSATEVLRQRNDRYQRQLTVPLESFPSLRVAVVTCMDARIDAYSMLGLRRGEAHVIRNAGGVVTEDVIRSLAVNQRKLGSQEVVIIHHTDCGMQTFTDDELADEIAADTGVRPTWRACSFTDVFEDVRVSVERVRSAVELPHRDRVSGFVFDVDSGALLRVSA